MKYNKCLTAVNRNKTKYGSLDLLRLHASERDLAFDQKLWNCFIDSLSQEDIRLYPNTDKAYDLLAQMLDTNKELLTVAEGSDRILKNTFQCFAVPGSKVVSTNPCFPMYNVYAKMYGASIIDVPYQTEHFPFEQFINAIDTETSLVILSNPSSPVGDALSIDQIKCIAEQCKLYDCILVVDEAYIEFSDCISAKQLVDRYNIIVVRTFSKAYGSAGVRIGYAVSNHLIKHYLNKVSSMNELSGLSIKWIEALYCYDDSAEYINTVKKNRSSLTAALIKCNVKYVGSQTNYINILGKLTLNGIQVKIAKMPWDNLDYTRVSIPADKTNFNQLLLEVSTL